MPGEYIITEADFQNANPPQPQAQPGVQPQAPVGPNGGTAPAQPTQPVQPTQPTGGLDAGAAPGTTTTPHQGDMITMSKADGEKLVKAIQNQTIADLHQRGMLKDAAEPEPPPQPKPGERTAFDENFDAAFAGVLDKAKKTGDNTLPYRWMTQEATKMAVGLAKDMFNKEIQNAMGSVYERINEDDARKVFDANPDIKEVEKQFRAIVEGKSESPYDDLMDIVKGVRKHQSTTQKKQEETRTALSRAGLDGFMESGAPRGSAASADQLVSMTQLQDQIAEAERTGDRKTRNELMRKYISRR